MASLPGLTQDDSAEAFAAFRLTAAAIMEQAPALRPALPVEETLRGIAGRALALGPSPAQTTAARFFADHFDARLVSGTEAFFTGYYEPVVDGALDESVDFSAPLLARPPDLVTFAADGERPAWAADLAAARRGADGNLSPFPVRAAIEAEIATGGYRPIIWLRDWVEVFLIQVQGSARVRLADGTRLRVTYAGRNGHPYTSIGRLLVESGAMAADAMSLARLKAWLRAAGQAPGEPGRTLMQRNASYIFFDLAPEAGEAGPIGGAGVPLTPLRSIAVDRTRWCYGLPFWIDACVPAVTDEPRPFRRLMIAQDTGSAIVGPARVDLYLGSGDEAGRRAGDIRHRGALSVLWPKPAGAWP